MLPPRCIDHDLVKEFRAVHPWESYADWSGTYLLTEDPDTLGSRIETIWTTRRWHVAHCLYMWKKLNRALTLGGNTDGEVIWQRHTDHCTTMILGMDPRDLDEIGTIVEVIYPPWSK